MSNHDPITIASVEARSFRRLTFARVEHVPGRGLVRVTGKNGSGKTSLLRAIMGALGGAGEVDEASLQEGSEKGELRVRLSNGFAIERRFTEAAPKGYLTVTSEDGGKYGQGKLDEWLGVNAFDPQAFFALSPDRQRDLLFRLGTDPDLPGKLEAVRAEYREAYERRTPIISERRHYAGIAQPEGERPEPVDTSAELAKLRELQAHNRARGDLAVQVRDAEHRAAESVREVNRIDHEIEDLLRRVEKLRDARGDAESARETHAQHAADLQKELKATPDRGAEAEAVNARLEEADAVARSLEPWRRFDEAQERLEALREQEANLTAELGALKAREGQLLEQAGIPVDGLSFDESGSPLLDGRTLSVASGADRVRMAVQVAMAANPDLRIVLLDEEANSLDEDALAALDELAVENGFQVWACRVVSDPASEVVVEDGVALDRATADQGAPELEGVGS